MKNLNHLILLTALCTLGQMMYAGRLSIENKTAFPAWIGVHQPHIRTTIDRQVRGGEVIYINTTSPVKRIEGVLSPVEGDSSKNITLKPWVSNPTDKVQWVHITGDYRIVTNLDPR